ncbi:MAG: bacillithiol biosynthesis cysteine-adding enzyme BshC [Saprospiraceae bacterium]|nr:bacillithiol biosynthesis cysteine-adding enzyme BshC [Saprospiraceae bacterium]
MKITSKAFKHVSHFSQTDIAFAEQDPRLMPFLNYQPSLSSFRDAINDKQSDETNRALLVQVLKDQYDARSSTTQEAIDIIDSLSDDHTFTITTAHQPVLFTGPLYVIYKIISAIKLARQLASAYPKYTFVPVFVTGGEDHDFDEINHTHLFGKEIKWEQEIEGPVGRLPTHTLKDALSSLEEILGSSPQAQQIFQTFAQIHEAHERYGMAFAALISHYFSPYGLIVLNMDHPALKGEMRDLFKDELLNHTSSKLVRETQEAIENAGFKPQAYVRDINLFYLEDGLRARIERTGNIYSIVDTDLSFSESEILQILEDHPEKFSPNVIMRPLYQESILPNLAYVGGGGELAYWMERKTQFEHFNINFPVLVRRDSYLWIPNSLSKRMAKLNLPVEDYFKDEDQQVKDFVATASEKEFKLGREKGALMKIFKEVEVKAVEIDPTLRSTIAAEARNQLKSLEKIEDKLRKAEKSKHETELGQLQKIREKLFPKGNLQERHVNFLDFYSRQPDGFFEVLMQASDPLDMQLKIIEWR